MQAVVGIQEKHRLQRGLGFDGDTEGPVVKFLQGRMLHIKGTLRENVHRKALADHRFQLANAFGPAFGAAAVHHYHHIPVEVAKNGHFSHFGLAQYPQLLAAYRLENDGNIQVRDMVGNEDVLLLPVVGRFLCIFMPDTGKQEKPVHPEPAEVHDHVAAGDPAKKRGHQHQGHDQEQDGQKHQDGPYYIYIMAGFEEKSHGCEYKAFKNRVFSRCGYL